MLLKRTLQNSRGKTSLDDSGFLHSIGRVPPFRYLPSLFEIPVRQVEVLGTTTGGVRRGRLYVCVASPLLDPDVSDVFPLECFLRCKVFHTLRRPLLSTPVGTTSLGTLVSVPRPSTLDPQWVVPAPLRPSVRVLVPEPGKTSMLTKTQPPYKTTFTVLVTPKTIPSVVLPPTTTSVSLFRFSTGLRNPGYS